MLLKLVFHIGVNGGRCIVQGCQQITSHIPHRPAVLLETLQHIVYVREIQGQKPLLHLLCGQFLTADARSWLMGGKDICAQQD